MISLIWLRVFMGVIVFSFVFVLTCGLMLLSLLGLHVVGAMNVAGGVASWGVDHIADTIAPAILEDTASAFPADIALTGCGVVNLKLSGCAEAFDLGNGDG